MGVGIEVITGFDQREHELLDRVRGKVADETARLALKWVAKGLLTYQIDTGETYQYTGIEPSNLIGDWVLFTAEGATGPAGADGADGVDGDKYATVSTTSLDVPQVHPTVINMTLGLNLAYTAGQSIIVVNSPTESFSAIVTSYDSGTGALVADSTSNVGTGLALANWQVNLAGTQGIAGNALIHIEADITLDEAKISTVEGGVWTTVAPWSASVFNDVRSNFTVPAALNGSMTGHSISYDGASWYDNGVWRGPTGIQGIQGNDGSDGSQGIQGNQGIQGLIGNQGIQGAIGPAGDDALAPLVYLYPDQDSGTYDLNTVAAGLAEDSEVVVWFGNSSGGRDTAALILPNSGPNSRKFKTIYVLSGGNGADRLISIIVQGTIYGGGAHGELSYRIQFGQAATLTRLGTSTTAYSIVGAPPIPIISGGFMFEATPSINLQWGFLSYGAGMSVVKTATGKFTITHNLGGFRYHIALTATDGERFVYGGTRSSNSFTVETKDKNGAFNDSSFYFQIFQY